MIPKHPVITSPEIIVLQEKVALATDQEVKQRLRAELEAAKMRQIVTAPPAVYPPLVEGGVATIDDQHRRPAKL